jgi:hypothetical protein
MLTALLMLLVMHAAGRRLISLSRGGMRSCSGVLRHD